MKKVTGMSYKNRLKNFVEKNNKKGRYFNIVTKNWHSLREYLAIAANRL